MSDLYAVPYDDPFGWVAFNSLYGLQFDERFTPSRIALYHVSQAIPGSGWYVFVTIRFTLALHQYFNSLRGVQFHDGFTLTKNIATRKR